MNITTSVVTLQYVWTTGFLSDLKFTSLWRMMFYIHWTKHILCNLSLRPLNSKALQLNDSANDAYSSITTCCYIIRRYLHSLYKNNFKNVDIHLIQFSFTINRLNLNKKQYNTSRNDPGSKQGNNFWN